MNEKHLNWCRSHDWGRNAVLRNGVIYGLIDSTVTNGIRTDKEISFKDFSKLRDWAGY
jgi:hypothetical protein